MGGLLNEPVKQVKLTQISFEQGSLNVYGAALQGWRKNMEDYLVHLKINDKVSMIGIFDGHGGPEVACYVSQVLPRELRIQPNLKLKNYEKALIKAFKRVDEMIISERGEEALKKIRKQLGINSNSGNTKIGMKVGCTANIVLITENKLYSANIGDSRSMLIRKQQIVALSSDHKPTNTYEKNRILKAGGKVANGRINGGLNISRAFGDFQLKSNPKKSCNEQMVINTPQIIELERTEQDQFIVIGSDGVWEHFYTKNELFADRIKKQVAKCDKNYHSFMQKMLVQFIGTNPESEIGCDNMTMILAKFQHS